VLPAIPVKTAAASPKCVLCVPGRFAPIQIGLPVKIGTRMAVLGWSPGVPGMTTSIRPEESHNSPPRVSLAPCAQLGHSCRRGAYANHRAGRIQPLYHYAFGHAELDEVRGELRAWLVQRYRGGTFAVAAKRTHIRVCMPCGAVRAAARVAECGVAPRRRVRAAARWSRRRLWPSRPAEVRNRPVSALVRTGHAGVQRLANHHSQRLGAWPTDRQQSIARSNTSKTNATPPVQEIADEHPV
jgi:hypothetical protein